MGASEAKSAASGSPRAWASSVIRRIIAVSSPRRRWVGSTVTRVIPAHPRLRPPGTAIWKLKIPAVATISPPSKAARVRSNSVIRRDSSSSSSRGLWAPKVRRSARL